MIIDEMTALANKYMALTARAPLGFVMGVKDFKAIEKQVMALQKEGHTGTPTILGLPIHFKMTSGIELLVDPTYAAKIIEEKDFEQRTNLIKGAIIR